MPMMIMVVGLRAKSTVAPSTTTTADHHHGATLRIADPHGL
jgi:hypothetical protein